MKNNSTSKRRSGFTIVELLIVIAVIGIMSALVVSSFSGAAQDTRRVMARQQQAAIQNAVNAWVTSRSTTVGISGSQAEYNAKATPVEKLDLFQGYLDDSTVSHLRASSGTTGPIRSAALKKVNQQINMPQWTNNSYPKVDLVDTP